MRVVDFLLRVILVDNLNHFDFGFWRYRPSGVLHCTRGQAGIDRDVGRSSLCVATELGSWDHVAYRSRSSCALHISSSSERG